MHLLDNRKEKKGGGGTRTAILQRDGKTYQRFMMLKSIRRIYSRLYHLLPRYIFLEFTDDHIIYFITLSYIHTFVELTFIYRRFNHLLSCHTYVELTLMYRRFYHLLPCFTYVELTLMYRRFYHLLPCFYIR
uniref:Uncharacterized protein n=1 Tax=Cacopsylla melanoneura TaxID=428564 RepID=A0A8D8QBN4_9HEMI